MSKKTSFSANKACGSILYFFNFFFLSLIPKNGLKKKKRKKERTTGGQEDGEQSPLRVAIILLQLSGPELGLTLLYIGFLRPQLSPAALGYLPLPSGLAVREECPGDLLHRGSDSQTNSFVWCCTFQVLVACVWQVRDVLLCCDPAGNSRSCETLLLSRATHECEPAWSKNIAQACKHRQGKSLFSWKGRMPTCASPQLCHD